LGAKKFLEIASKREKQGGVLPWKEVSKLARKKVGTAGGRVSTSTV